jgi:hypothetical protein
MHVVFLVFLAIDKYVVSVSSFLLSGVVRLCLSVSFVKVAVRFFLKVLT